MSYWQYRCRERTKQRHDSISSVERLERPRSITRTDPALSTKLAGLITTTTRPVKESSNVVVATDAIASDTLNLNVNSDTAILPEAHSNDGPEMVPHKIFSTSKLLDSSILPSTLVQAAPTVPAPLPTQILSPQSPRSPTFGTFPLSGLTFPAGYDPARYRRQILPTRPVLNGIPPFHLSPAANATAASAGDNAEVTTHTKDTKRRSPQFTLEANQSPNLTRSTAITATSPTTVTSFFTRTMTPTEATTPFATPTPTSLLGASAASSVNPIATGALVSSIAASHPLPCIRQSSHSHSQAILGLQPPQQEEAIATPVPKKGRRLWDRRLLALKRRPFFTINSSNNDCNSTSTSSACSSLGPNSSAPATTSTAVTSFTDTARSNRPTTQSEEITATTATMISTKATRREICDTSHISRMLVNQTMIMTSPVSMVMPKISLANPGGSKRSLKGGSHRGVQQQ
ncbi:hypothetical protein BGZ50_002889 [Haplosporangium sp. Z 11]|nr:hypothetical protein BGZ50_002889 [Haplosporangium sp. Z 11]